MHDTNDQPPHGKSASLCPNPTWAIECLAETVQKMTPQHSPGPAGKWSHTITAFCWISAPASSDLRPTLYIIELHYFFSQMEIENKASLWVHWRNPGLLNIRTLKIRLFTLLGKRQFYCCLEKAVTPFVRSCRCENHDRDHQLCSELIHSNK